MPKNNVIPFATPISFIVSVSLGTGCYRHIQIAANNTLEQLHQAIIKEFGFDDDHLHAFFMSNRGWDRHDCYYSKHADGGPFTNKTTLTAAGLVEDKKFLYIYDFGDEWRFACRVVRRLAVMTPAPICVRSKGEPPAQYADEADWCDEEDDSIFDQGLMMQLAQKMLETWKNAAIVDAKPADTLREQLACRDKAELVKMLEEFGAQKVGRWSRDKLIEALAGYLVKPEVLRKRLLTLDPDQWDLCKQAAAHPRLTMEESELDVCAVPHILGLLQPYRQGKKYYCVMPQEIREVLQRLLDKGLEEELQRNLLLLEYAMAACNLYGVIPIQEFVDLLNSQNVMETDLEEVQTVLGPLTAEPGMGYCLWESYLVHEALWVDDFAAAEDCLARMGDKPRYAPSKEELLRYADINYFERTPQMTALANYLTIQHGMDADRLEGFLDELHMLAFFNHETDEALALLADEYEIYFDGKQLQQGFFLLTEVINNTRIWINKGYTPTEMVALKSKAAPLRLAAKVGRNEPCPCGSGKKYKHCCGQ